MPLPAPFSPKITLKYLFWEEILMHKSFCQNENGCKNLCLAKKCLKRLVALVEKRNGQAKKKLIEKAFFFAMDAHKGQFRASKKPYFLHPLETAAILAKIGLSSEVVAAGLLHDVLEDSDATPAQIRKIFGKEVCLLVEGVTKIDLLASETRNQNALKNLQNLLFATTRDPRVILIKLADKLHNLRTLEFLPERDRRRIGNEALLIYVPIAHKIGLESIALELEDLAFMHAKPETFEALDCQLYSLRSAKARDIDKMVLALKKKIPNAKFEKLERSSYASYSKMKNTGKTPAEINDYVVLKVLVKTRPDCYLALGQIHELFPPLPNKFKDFVSVPKPNGYMVLQTTVFGPGKKPVKVRISTHGMDCVNSNGVVEYRRRFGEVLPKSVEHSLSSLGFILDSHGPNEDFFYNLRSQVLKRPVYVFTVKGKLVELPKGSTVLDFAFATEKNWALHLLKAKVNGKRADFSDILDFGQVVELFFSRNKKAKKSWVKDVHTILARDSILKSFEEKPKQRIK